MRNFRPGIVRSLIWEIRDFVRFFQLPTSSKRIVFYSEHKGYSGYLEPFILELRKRDPHPLVYISSDLSDRILHQSDPRIIPIYSKILAPILFLVLDCKVMVMTLPGLNVSYMRRSIHSVRYAYVFHSLVSTKAAYKENEFDHYDAIFCVGSFQKKEILDREKQIGLRPKVLAHVGYPRLEELYSQYQKMNRTPRERKVVLVAPSVTDENFIDDYGMGIVETLLGDNYEVILRPHPEKARRNPHLWKEIRDKMKGRSGFTYDLAGYPDESILKADLLITDFSGIALRFAFGTERPVLFIQKGKKRQDPDALEFSIRDEIGRLLRSDELGQLSEQVRRLFQDEALYKGQIRRLREQTIYNFGTSAAAGAEALLRLVSEGD